MSLLPRIAFVVALLALLGCGGSRETGRSTQVTGGQAPPLDPGLAEGTPSATPPPRPESAAFTLLESRIVDDIGQSVVAYTSGDLQVKGVLFLPPGDGRHPAVLFNHGGVSGVSNDMKRRGRDLAALGYVVLAPSYRGEDGSDGVVEVAKGEVDDVLAGASVLADHPRVDPDRMAVTGTSHGALISVLAAAREPDRFRCVVSACGVMDVVSWYEYLLENDFDVSDSLSVAIYGSGPADKPEAFRIRQAVRVADRITAPLLLQQGLQDRIVPPAQARLMEAAVREAGGTVTLLEYPLLGHAFWGWTLDYHSAQEIDEADVAWSEFTAFLDRHLRAD